MDRNNAKNGFDSVLNCKSEFIVMIAKNTSDTLISILDNHAKTHPDKLAYTFLAENGKTALTNYELWKKVIALASRLLVMVKTESRAIVLLPPGLDYVVAFLGCLRAGVIAVPAYPLRNNRHIQRLLAVIHDARAEVIITTSALAQQYPLAKVLTLEIDDVVSSQTYSESLPEIIQDKLAFLQYTSGSTGSPKGVMVSHGNIIANANLIDSLLAENCKTVCSWLPPFHDMGLIGAILYPLYKNIHSILMAPTTFLKKPFLWLKAISDYKADVSPAPNFAYEMCVKRVTEAEKKELDLSHWLVALNGAEPVNAKTLMRFSAAFESCGFRAGSCYPAYGMAETTLMVSGKKPGDSTVILEVDKQALQTKHHLVLKTSSDRATVVSCGHTIASHEIKIINPKTKGLLPSYKIGEIVVAGPSITQGYWDKPKLTQQTFAFQLPHSDKKFLRTGDLGFTDETGQLFITGRLKDLIIIHGQNIYPQDIEHAVAESHPALIHHGSAAFLMDFAGESELVVVQEVHRSAKNFEAIFTAILKRCAEDFSILPAQISLIQHATIPKTSSGKIQRNTCRDALLKGELKVVKEWKQVSNTATITQPMIESHDLQNWMRQWFAEQLNLTVQQIDIKTNFSYYGVDPGLTVKFCAALDKRLDRTINPGLLWSYPTIDELAEYLLTNHIGSKVKNITQQSIPKKNFEPIAIVGMSCRFPGDVKTPAQFWELLQSSKDGITDSPDKRWDIEQYYDFYSATADKIVNRKGGFIDAAEQFDTALFNINRRDIAVMETRYQLLLKLIGEALEAAGIAPLTINNTDTTLFVGISSNDYYHHLVSDSLHQPINGYYRLGNLHRAAVSKIAYFLGTHGQSLAIDTACSSSLVAVLNACQSLQDDVCNLAIVGGVNTILEPTLSQNFPNMDMLSPQGKCQVFDKEADGYVRSEGCGVLILKRLRDAEQQGDKIMAVIQSAVSNSGSHRDEIASSSTQAQKELISKALTLAGLSADDLGYIEAHGTGIRLGDSIELNALKEVFATGKRRSPLYIGSVKSNIGHLEAAAGIAGLIKTVLMLEHKQIPPNLHFKAVNPLIELNTIPAKIPTQLEQWVTPNKLIRYAGVSSFGFTGINVHLILTEIP